MKPYSQCKRFVFAPKKAADALRIVNYFKQRQADEINPQLPKDILEEAT